VSGQLAVLGSSHARYARSEQRRTAGVGTTVGGPNASRAWGETLCGVRRKSPACGAVRSKIKSGWKREGVCVRCGADEFDPMGLGLE
jgi:hypothetical protein